MNCRHHNRPSLSSKNASEKQGWGAPECAEYPDAAGFRNTDTSREAAEAINPKLGRLQALALDAIAGRGILGFTADELAEAVGLNRYSVQPRLSELLCKGLIVDSGQRRRNSSGRLAIVWVCPKHKRVAV